MIKKIFIIVGIIFALSMFACTSQQRVKKYGGSTKVNLPVNKKLVTATWKGDNLWLLYRNKKASEYPEIYSFKENSSWGMLEGEIIIQER